MWLLSRVNGAVLALALLAGCASPGDTPPATPGSGPGSAPVPPGAGPLEQYVYPGFQGTTAGEVSAEVAAQQEAIAACMMAEGVEYVPMVLDPGTFRTGDEPVRGTREFAEVYGYGVWHTPEVEPGQFTFELDDSANRAHRDSLSPAAQEAYDAALHGELTESGSVRTYDGSGCARAAEVDPDADEEHLESVVAEARTYLESLVAGTEPRLAEVDASWSSCMVDTGHRYASPYAAEAAVIDEIIAAYAEAPDSFLEPVVVEEYAEQERRLALADIACRESVGWAERRRAIEVEVQQEYVDPHRADLDAVIGARLNATEDPQA